MTAATTGALSAAAYTTTYSGNATPAGILITLLIAAAAILYMVLMDWRASKL